MSTGRMLGLGIGVGLGLGSAFSGMPIKTFNLLVKTDNVGSSNDDQFTLSLDGTSTYNFDWRTSDGQTGTHTVNTDLTFTFPGGAGNYTIKFGGVNNTLPHIAFNNMDDVLKVLAISNYGNIVWDNWNNAWNGCKNMIITAPDVPNVASSTRFSSALQNTAITVFLFNGWDLTNAGQANGMLRDCTELITVDMTGGNLSTITDINRFIKNSPLVVTIIGLTSTGMVPVNMEHFAQGATLYNQDLSGLDFTALTNGINALFDTAFSTANWDLLLVSLDGQSLQSAVTWHAGNANYTEGAVDSGTTDGLGASKLIQSGQNFLTTVSVGDIIHNTTDDTFASVTNVDSDTQLSLSADIMISGETYVVQGSAPAKAHFSIITNDSWTLIDNGPI